MPAISRIALFAVRDRGPRAPSHPRPGPGQPPGKPAGRRRDFQLHGNRRAVDHRGVTRPYLIVGSTFMVKNDSPLRTMDRAGKPEIKIGVLVGSSHQDIFKRVTPAATMVPFKTTAEAFGALSASQIDTMILDSLQNAAFPSKNRLNFRNLPGNWSYEETSIGVPTGDVDWLRIVDTFVRELTGSGESARLFKKHFGYDMPPL